MDNESRRPPSYDLTSSGLASMGLSMSTRRRRRLHAAFDDN